MVSVMMLHHGKKTKGVIVLTDIIGDVHIMVSAVVEALVARVIVFKKEQDIRVFIEGCETSHSGIGLNRFNKHGPWVAVVADLLVNDSVRKRLNMCSESLLMYCKNHGHKFHFSSCPYETTILQNTVCAFVYMHLLYTKFLYLYIQYSTTHW